MYDIKRWRTLANSPRISRGDYEFLTIGPTPHDEKCTQAGTNLPEGILECTIYGDLLQRVYGNPPYGCELVVLESIHDDAGPYHEIGIIYKMDDGPCEDYAMKIESGCDKWDELALQALREANHSLYTGKVIKMKAA